MFGVETSWRFVIDILKIDTNEESAKFDGDVFIGADLSSWPIPIPIYIYIYDPVGTRW